MAETNIIIGVLKLKCPKCREGNLFLNKNSYQIKGFFDMPNNCSKCGQDFQIETGFYYGAMYVSYGITIALTVAVFVALTVLNLYSITSFLIADVITLLITMPYVFKLSRAIWIKLMIKYDKDAIKKYGEKA